MDNAQLTDPDGRWYLFADWQGMTRVGLPGDEVTTNADLDRPHETGPLALRADGRVRSTHRVDIEPMTLTAVAPDRSSFHTPDPLGGPDLELSDDGQELGVRGRTVRLRPRGEPIALGGAPGRCEAYGGTLHALYGDHSIVVYFDVEERTHVALVGRMASGAGRLRWCVPVLRPQNGSPDAFREQGSTWLGDRDLVHDIAYLVEVQDDGTVGETNQAPAIAGPWRLDGQVWWQPDAATLCVGPGLGAPAGSFVLPERHAGPGRLLRLSGRRLYVPWHGGALLDLAAEMRELSRAHQPADAPMYHAAERLLRPIRAGMARRGVRVAWTACTRTRESVVPRLEIAGPTDLLTFILSHALDGHLPPALLGTNATAVAAIGGRSPASALAAASSTTERELNELIDVLDAAGISRARGFVHLHALADAAAESGSTLQLDPEVDALALAAVLSGLRGETRGPVPLASDDALADAVGVLSDRARLTALGLEAADVGLFLAIFGQRALGPAAAAPVRAALLAIDRGHAKTVARALGQALEVAAAPVAGRDLDPAQAQVAGVLEAALAHEFGFDAAASRDGGVYRFGLDGLEFRVGLDGELDLVATLCRPGVEVDGKALARRIKAANKGRTGPAFAAVDGEIQLRMLVPFVEASVERVTAAIEACRAAADSPQGEELRAAYRW